MKLLPREKGRDLTQSYDKSPYTQREIQQATWQHKNATKTLITQWLRTDSTVTPLTDQTLLQFWTYHRTGPYYQFWPYYHISRGFHRTLQRVRLANIGLLLFRTPGPVPFGTCICCNVETILSWTCHTNGPFEFRTSLGTSMLLRTGSWSNSSHPTGVVKLVYERSTFQLTATTV